MRERLTSLKHYLESEQIVSVMNNTKWNRLFEELEHIADLLRFRRKDLRDRESIPLHWGRDFYHVSGGQEVIEWLEISAVLERHRGQLAEPSIEDNSQTLLAALHRSGVPYCVSENVIRVWGYLRPGISPDWVARDA